MKSLNCFRFQILRMTMCFVFFNLQMNAQSRYFIIKSIVNFESDAPLEIIKASSSDMRGVIDPVTHTFGFSVTALSFKGFNSELQRTHFNENYIESDKYPEITFSGKIIDDIDFSKPGIYSVRAKGNFSVKGISRERIIRSTVEVKENSIELKSDFEVLLADYDIRIPRVVYQKISPVILISMKVGFQLQKGK